MKIQKHILFAGLALLTGITTARSQGTAFTYQGRLNDGGHPANGTYDLTFALFNVSSNGAAFAGPMTNGATSVSNGQFSVTLDFGSGVFNGANYWLEIGVQTNGGNAFTTLVPRQPLLPVPYAMMASSASNLLGSLPASQLSPGTASINITGNAATASSAATVGGVTAPNVASGVNAALAATSANTPSTILARDANGALSAGSVTLSSNLFLPGPNATIYSGGDSLLRSDTSDNFFAGPGAGNLTATGFGNTANGYQALALATSGGHNVANGYEALHDLTTGDGNTAIGYQAAQATISGQGNIAIGLDALLNNTSGNFNIAIGNHAGFNIGFGSPPGSNNIHIGNMGLPTDTNLIRIGDGQAQAFIAGVLNGNGSGLTNLSPAKIGAGTAGINITGNAATATMANGFSGGLSGDVTGTQGATVVSAVGGATAANVASGVNAALAATSANTPSTIAARDANGALSAGSLTLNSNLYLPGPISTIYSGNDSLMRSDTGDNFFAGPGAGNLATTGFGNTANGYQALALAASGGHNVANGYEALHDVTNGDGNTAIGYQAAQSTISGLGNTAIGLDALLNNTSGNYNIAIGNHSGFYIGFGSPPGSNNIHIGNMGLPTDTNIIRIGDGQTQAFIAGVINGNGAGLTNLNAGQLTGGTVPLSQLPAALVTNNATGITLNGNFSGNGAGLTNVASATIGNYVHSYSTSTQVVASANTFQNITNQIDVQINGWVHSSDGVSLTNKQTGLYLIHYHAEVTTSSGTPTTVSLRAAANGVEIEDSQACAVANQANQPMSCSKSFIANVNTGDVITFQLAGPSTTDKIVSNNGLGTTRPSFSCNIVRIQ